MKGKLWYEINSGPLDEEWLEAEFYLGEQPFAKLTEWGKKLIFFAPCRMLLEIETEEILELLQKAKERVACDICDIE